MGNDIAVFDFNAKKVRTLSKDGEILFRASDVGTILDMRGSDIVRNLEEEDVHKVHGVDSLEREKEVSYLSESGLYTILIRSNKPAARPFRRWVTGEVLPALRKQGYYVTEKLKDELAQKDLEIIRKEQVILQLQSKKKRRSPRVSVPNYNVLDGFEPRMELMRIDDLLEPEKSMSALRRTQSQIEGLQKKEKVLKNILKLK